MMTLLMVLFIVMFAISSINQGKFNQLKEGLQQGLRGAADHARRRPGHPGLRRRGRAGRARPIDGQTEGGTGGTDV